MVGNQPNQLQVSGVTYQYRTSRANALDVDCTFDSGRTIILGPNGAGKSTLFGLCSNRLRLQLGTVTLQLRNHTLESPSRDYRAEIGAMQQSPAFIKGLTTSDFLVYAAWLAGLDLATAKKATELWLNRVNLVKQSDTRCHELSGGMQRRLAFAAASIHEPSVLLLDEPTAGLDPLERSAFREVITSFSSEAIVLIATHQIDDLDLVADKIAVLSNGHMVFHDSVTAFLSLADPALQPLAQAEAAYATVIRRGMPS